MKKTYKKILKILLHYAFIPFLASFLGLFGFFGLSIIFYFVSVQASAYILYLLAGPTIIAIIYFLFRKKIDMVCAAKTNGIIILILLVIFTIMMVITKGNIESSVMRYFDYLVIPFFPLTIIMSIANEYMLSYLCILLSYSTAFIIASCYEKIKIKQYIILGFVVLVCIIINIFSYQNRPSIKYSGHGFNYMNGYSSTDFTNYTVYSNNSKLVKLNHKSSFIIENEKEMPILDGAEACYPLYAAFAKAVYKDIDKIELTALGSDYQYVNGKIVSFTNSVEGFSRLLHKNKFENGVDMFFGAYPSADQLEEAKELGVELEITPIGKEAFVFFVENNNQINNITIDELKAIYHGDITNWDELGGSNLKIIAFQRPKNSGSQTMMEYFMGDVSLMEPKTYEVVSAMEGVIKRVAQYANEKGALGYSFRYFLEELVQEKGVKMLSINEVYPTLDNIENGRYPLTVDLCVITRKDDTNPNIQKMVDFILSKEGQEIIRNTGYAAIYDK